ncbi:MAG: hypothetical protein ACI8RE_000795 [Ilumatobacter sp.]|jgi:hypothetical protein
MRSNVAARSRGRTWVFASATALGAGLTLTASVASVSARPIVILDQVESAPTGASAQPVGEQVGSHASISGDGKYVVYQGLPEQPVTAEGETPEAPIDERASTIYLSNREDGSTVELTGVPDGIRSGNSVRPIISGDGCSVVAVTEMALDLFRDDDVGERWDVYRSVLPHCEGTVGNWELVSTRNDGSSLARDDIRPEFSPTVSRSGTAIAFVHPDERLFDAPDVNTITLIDLTVPPSDPGRAQIVGGMPIGRPNTIFVHVGLDQPALSDDGRYLAYRSDAFSAEAVPVWGTGQVDGARATRQVFVWDRLEPDPFQKVQLVSALPTGEPTTAGAGEPVVSRVGRVIAFTSGDQDLVSSVFPTCTDDCPTQIFRLDRDTDADGVYDEVGETVLEIVSAEPITEAAPIPVAGRAASSQPTLSADGQLLAFVSKAPNLQLIEAPGSGEALDGDILVASAGIASLRRITVLTDGVRPTIGAHSRPDLSDTGRITVFDTLAAAQLLDEGAASGRQIVALSSPTRVALADADVGTTVVGLESAGWFVSLVNEGPSAFDPATVTIDDSRFSIDPDESSCVIGTLVPAGARCNVSFTFTPISDASVSATITIAEQGFEALSVSAIVSGSGGEPALQIYPGGGDFGKVAVGQSATEFLFDVSNVGFVSSSVERIEVVGEQASEFSITTNNCADRPLNPRANCAVGITFTPSEAGRRTVLIEAFTPQGQSTSVILAGDGVFEPELVTLRGTVQAGEEFVLGGSDYPANTELVVVFGDEPENKVNVTTNDGGDFIAVIPVQLQASGGARRVVVQSSQGVAAVVPMEVIEDDNMYIGLPGFGLG